MVTLNLFLADVPPERRFVIVTPKPGDFVWIRLEDGSGRTDTEECIRVISKSMRELGLEGKVAVVISQKQHDLSILSEEEMGKMGWVRKHKE